MKLTREKLKKIIKEELKQIFLAKEAEENTSNPQIASFAKKIANIIKIDANKAKAMSNQWKLAQDLILTKHHLEQSEIDTIMPDWQDIDPLAIKFYLRKRFITPQEIEKELNNAAKGEVKKSALSFIDKIKTIKPSEMMKNVGPTYGHTEVGIRKIPAEKESSIKTDEEAVKYLRNQFKGWPLWKLEFLRDPEDNKIYAYYELDTSG